MPSTRAVLGGQGVVALGWRRIAAAASDDAEDLAAGEQGLAARDVVKLNVDQSSRFPLSQVSCAPFRRRIPSPRSNDGILTLPNLTRTKGERMAVRSVLYLRPKPGSRAALIKAFTDLDVPGQAMQQAGCLGVELQGSADEQAPLLVTALWTNRAAYDGWLANPWRAESSAEIEPLLAEEPWGDVFDLLVTAGQPGGPVPSDDAKKD